MPIPEDGQTNIMAIARQLVLCFKYSNRTESMGSHICVCLCHLWPYLVQSWPL